MIPQTLGPMFAVFAAALVRADKRIVRELMDAGATSADHAIALDTARLRRIRIPRLTNAGALIRLEDGRYYLDEAGWQKYRVARRTRIVVAAITAVFVAMWWAGR